MKRQELENDNEYNLKIIYKKEVPVIPLDSEKPCEIA